MVVRTGSVFLPQIQWATDCSGVESDKNLRCPESVAALDSLRYGRPAALSSKSCL